MPGDGMKEVFAARLSGNQKRFLRRAVTLSATPIER
jgi:hypothetical protein